MKILQINATYGVGSTGKIAKDISAKLIKQGHESYAFWATACKLQNDVTSLYRIGNTFDHKLHAVLRRISGKQGWYSKRATKKVCKKILEIKPDVVHLHNLHSNYINLPILLDFLAKDNIPTLLTLHDCWLFTGNCNHYYKFNCDKWKQNCSGCPMLKGKTSNKLFEEKRALFEKNKNLAVNGVSIWTVHAAKESILNKATIIKCIYNGIDSDLFSPACNAQETRIKYNVPQNHKLILGAAQGWSNDKLLDYKGLKEFISIADSLKDEATVILVGENNGVPERENLHCIGFTNSVKELVELYSAADAFVNPSRMETFGLVTVEAMSCGTPVVAYNNTGSAEIVSSDCGVLVEDGNADELVEAVKKVLSSGKETFTVNCRNRVLENFNKDTQIQKYLDIYEEIITVSKEANKID